MGLATRAFLILVVALMLEPFCAVSCAQTPTSGKFTGKMDLVAETKPGSGKYEVLEAAPIFPADSGKGSGQPRWMTMENPKIVMFSLMSDVDPSKIAIIDADLGGPKAHFKGLLTETAAGSGIFIDNKKTVTVMLPAQFSTSPETYLMPVKVDSDTLGIHNAWFVMQYHESRMKSGGGTLTSLITSAEITFSAPYDPKQTNRVQVRIVAEYEDPETGATSGGYSPLDNPAKASYHGNPSDSILDFTESSPGSLSFESNATPSTFTITRSTGEDPSHPDSLDVRITQPTKQGDPMLLTLTKAETGSLKFSAAATIGEKPEDNEGSDVPPDDPEVTGDGVFRIRIRGADGPAKLKVKTDINAVETTALPTKDDPKTLLSGKLILVPKDASGNTHFKTIKTLYTTSAAGTVFIEVVH